MCDLFTMDLRLANGMLTTTAKWEGRSASEISQPQWSDAYATNKKKLGSREPGLGIKSVQDHRAVTISLGTELFQQVFAGSVLTLYREYRATREEPRIALHLDRALYGEPWELLSDPADAQAGDFLSLLGSVVRFDSPADQLLAETTVFAPTADLNCLFVSPPAQRTASREAVPDWDPTADKLEGISYLNVKPATFAQFSGIADNTKLQPQGFIFYGHGEWRRDIGCLVFVAKQGSIPGLYKWVDDLRSGDAVCTALAPKKQLRFSCMMCCESAWIGDGGSAVPFENTVVGALLAQTRIGFVIGTQLKVNFSAAAQFVAETIKAIVEDRAPLDLAMRRGRRAVKALEQDEDEGPQAPFDWWVPVLYAKSKLFDIVAHPPMVPLPKPMSKVW